MPLILRRFQTFPMLQPDNTMLDVPFATVAFVDERGQQYAQLNVEASEIPEYCHPFEGDGKCSTCGLTPALHIADHLVLSLGAGHGVDVPSEHAEMIGVGATESQSLI